MDKLEATYDLAMREAEHQRAAYAKRSDVLASEAVNHKVRLQRAEQALATVSAQLVRCRVTSAASMCR